MKEQKHALNSVEPTTKPKYLLNPASTKKLYLKILSKLKGRSPTSGFSWKEEEEGLMRGSKQGPSYIDMFI